MVNLEEITKKYKETFAVKNCNLKLRKGKIYGLVGKNGAGKTTIMRIIAGLSIPTKGTITLLSKRIGTLIETPSLNGNMTAEENLNFYRRLCDKKNTAFSNKELLELVGLTDTKRKKPKTFRSV